MHKYKVIHICITFFCKLWHNYNFRNITINMRCFNNYLVNNSILLENAKNIKKNIGPNCKLCAVVKANGYGTGFENVCNVLKGVADFFACATLKEGLSIREFDKETPILILGHVDEDCYDLVSENNLSISIGSVEQLYQLKSNYKNRINIHLQVNTGLNRFGFSTISEFVKSIKIIESNTSLNLEGVYSHFATKSEDIAFINKQFLRFSQFKKRVKNNNVIFHISNSFGVLHSNKLHIDMVRCGLLLYGYLDNNIGNLPIVSITSRVMYVKNVKKGESIGYNRTFYAKKSMRVAVIPMGYADGYNRNLSNKSRVLICGKSYRVVGLICMDVFMIDVTGSDVSVGDRVTILGENGGDVVSLNELSDIVGTSPYELLCNFNTRRMNYITINNNFCRL